VVLFYVKLTKYSRSWTYRKGLCKIYIVSLGVAEVRKD